MTASHSTEYSFVPKSWVFPDDTGTFQQHCKEMKRKGVSRVYIVKPLTNSQAGWDYWIYIVLNFIAANYTLVIVSVDLAYDYQLSCLS